MPSEAIQLTLGKNFHLDSDVAWRRASSLATLALTENSALYLQPLDNHREILAAIEYIQCFYVSVRLYPDARSSWLITSSLVPYLLLSFDVKTREGYWRWFLEPGNTPNALILPEDRSLVPLTQKSMTEIIDAVTRWYQSGSSVEIEVV